MTDPTNAPATAAEPAVSSASAPAPQTPAPASPLTDAAAPAPARPAAVSPSAARPVGGTTPQKRGLIGWFMFYAEDLMAPITKPGRTCERCKRRMWRGYLLSAPASGVKGVADMQIVCWRCKLSAAQQEMARLRTTGRR